MAGEIASRDVVQANGSRATNVLGFVMFAVECHG